MPTTAIDHRLEAVNSRFNTGVIVSQRISLGLDATEDNLAAAATKAAALHRQLASGTFTWQQRANPGALPPAASSPAEFLTEAVERLKTTFQNDPVRMRNPGGSRSTWGGAYRPYLRRLAKVQEETQLPLGTELLQATLETYAVATRSRKACGTVLAAIAKQEAIDLPNDWSRQSGGYGLRKADRRELPTDAEIEQAWSAISSPEWQWVFGMMATYGLRPSEVFFLGTDRLVNDGQNGNCPVRVKANNKTGERLAYPLPRGWVQTFSLQDVRLPRVRTDLNKTTLKKVGNSVSGAFRKYSAPIKPYDLRHAWAVRAVHAGLSDSIAARMMGHSGAVHVSTYHYWMQERDLDRGYAAAVGA